jgi:hypothetical protein
VRLTCERAQGGDHELCAVVPAMPWLAIRRSPRRAVDRRPDLMRQQRTYSGEETMNKKFVCKTTGVLMLVAAVLMIGPPAQAAETDGPLAGTGSDIGSAMGEGDGVLAGNGVDVDLDVPIVACGVGVAGAGLGTGICHPGGPLATTGDDTTTANGSGSGVGTGNGVAVDADIPVVLCGIGVALLGLGTGICA